MLTALFPVLSGHVWDWCKCFSVRLLTPSLLCLFERLPTILLRFYCITCSNWCLFLYHFLDIMHGTPAVNNLSNKLSCLWVIPIINCILGPRVCFFILKACAIFQCIFKPEQKLSITVWGVLFYIQSFFQRHLSLVNNFLLWVTVAQRDVSLSSKWSTNSTSL